MTKKKSRKKPSAERKLGTDVSTTFVADVVVSFKPTVNDPQGLTVRSALDSLGFSSVESVRSGKFFQIRLTATGKKDAERQLDEMCSRLLANPVIETYSFKILVSPNRTATVKERVGSASSDWHRVSIRT